MRHVECVIRSTGPILSADKLRSFSHYLSNALAALDRLYKKLRDAEITAVGRCVYTMMLYTRLASAVAVCIAIRGRYTQLAWLANPNPNPNPTNSSYG